MNIIVRDLKKPVGWMSLRLIFIFKSTEFYGYFIKTWATNLKKYFSSPKNNHFERTLSGHLFQ